MRYRVLTWDGNLQRFTKQRGVPSMVCGCGALRRALRELQRWGYPCNRDDPAVLVESVDPEGGE